MKRGALVLVLVLVIAACGGGSDDDDKVLNASNDRKKSTTTSSTTSTTETTPTTIAEPPVTTSVTTIKPASTTTTAAQPATTTTAAPPTTTLVAPQNHPLTIKNFAFSPAVLQVHVGDTVTAKNDDSTTHTWTADDGSWNSGNLSSGASFSHAFSAAGTFTYHCNIHSSMKGTIRVS